MMLQLVIPSSVNNSTQESRSWCLCQQGMCVELSRNCAGGSGPHKVWWNLTCTQMCTSFPVAVGLREIVARPIRCGTFRIPLRSFVKPKASRMLPSAKQFLLVTSAACTPSAMDLLIAIQGQGSPKRQRLKPHEAKIQDVGHCWSIFQNSNTSINLRGLESRSGYIGTPILETRQSQPNFCVWLVEELRTSSCLPHLPQPTDVCSAMEGRRTHHDTCVGMDLEHWTSVIRARAKACYGRADDPRPFSPSSLSGSFCALNLWQDTR